MHLLPLLYWSLNYLGKKGKPDEPTEACCTLYLLKVCFYGTDIWKQYLCCALRFMNLGGAFNQCYIWSLHFISNPWPWCWEHRRFVINAVTEEFRMLAVLWPNIHVCIPAFVCMFVGRLSKTLYNPVSPNKKKITRLNCFHLQNKYLFFCSVWHTEITLRGSVLQVILIILYYLIIIWFSLW